jgi:hypothetical protein
MFKAKLAAIAVAALATGTIAFASASEARTAYYNWGWGWGTPIGYSSYVTPAGRHCHWLAEYTDWGFYVGNNMVCSRR